jgi:adenylate cyclase
VNLGARLEGLCKTYGVELVVSESTKAQAAADFNWLELDRVMVKGKQQAVTIYTPLPADAGAAPPEWQAMLDAYRQQRWDDAQTLLAQVRLPAGYAALHALYADRLTNARRLPPQPDWDGATRFDTK